MVSQAAAPGHREPASWRALALFGFYHLVVGTVLLLLQEQGSVDALGLASPALFRTVAWLFVAVAPAILFFALLQHPRFGLQIHAVLVFDIAALTLLLHAGGSVDSGAGLLLAVSLAIGLPLTSGMSPFFFAALASSAVIGEQALAHAAGSASPGGYLHAGLLGTAFFSIALLDYTLSRRLRASELKIQEQEIDLEDLNAVNAFVIGLLDVGVVVVDADHRVRTLNAQAQRWLNGDATVRPPLPLAALSPELSHSFEIWKVLDGQGAGRTSAVSTDQKDFSVEFAPLGSGADRGAVLVIRDLEQIRAESHKAQLAAIGQMSAAITHEIRNPLSAISQAAQLLRDDSDLTERQRRVTELVLRNSERLNGVVDNVLSLSRRRDPVPRPVELCPFVTKVADQVRATAASGPATVEVHCRSDVQALIDPGHLEQVLNILGDNAARHAANPELKIDITVDVDGHGRPFVEISDNGPGIPADLRKDIFEPFFTTGNGTGIGLFLARQFCEVNQAKLALVSAANDSGARFRVSMPAAMAEQGTSASETTAQTTPQSGPR